MLYFAVHFPRSYAIVCKACQLYVCIKPAISGAYTEIVLRGGPGVEVEVNLVSCYRPRGVWGHAPPGKFLKYLSQMVHYKSILKVIWEQKT